MMQILCILIVTSTTLFALLSLWAATSPRHWFLRAAIVGGTLSLLLLIPAYELLVCFGTQAVLVSVFFVARGGLIRRKKRRTTSNTPANVFESNTIRRHLRFSLQTLLMVMLVVAVLVGLGIRLPKLDWIAWTLVVGVGAQAAIQTLMAVWIVSGTTWKWLRIPLAVLIPLTSLAALALVHESLVLQFFPTYLDFPFDPFGEHVGYFFDPGFFEPGRATQLRVETGNLSWLCETFGVSLAIVALTTALLALFSASSMHRSPVQAQTQDYRRLVVRILAGVATLLIAILPARVYWRLLRPAPIPSVSLPAPNGFNALLQAGQILPTTNSIFDDPGLGTLSQVRDEVAKYQGAFDLAQLGLDSEYQKPVRYGPNDVDDGEWQFMRRLSRAIRSAGLVAKADKDFAEAARQYSNVTRLGHATGKGGLIIDGLVGLAIQGVGLHGLWSVSSELTNAECKKALEVLLTVDSAWEPTHEFCRRDRIWSEHCFGWQSRLENAMRELSDDPDDHRVYDFAFRRGQVARRLLIIDFAIRAYQVDNQRLPLKLVDLIPAYLPAAPGDPFGEGPLVYRREEEAYVLYSIGPDGVDDGGKGLANDTAPNQSGDWFLETLFQDDQFRFVDSP